MKRDTVWHELYDRMTGYDCPICRLIETRLDSFMQSILYEGVNDPGIREKLQQSEGLCNAHAYQLMALGDPLGHAIVYLDLIKLAIKKISEKSGKPDKGKMQKKCLFCESVQQGEQIYVSHFVDSLSDQVFLEQYQKQSLLCLQHYQVVYARLTNPDLAGRVRQSTIQRYRMVIDDLNEIKRKNDYRYVREEWSPSARTAWQKAVAIINGYPGMNET